MQIIAQCPSCGFSWLLDETSADRRITCKNCRRLFKIPKLEDVPKAVRVMKDAHGAVYVDESGKTYG